MAEYPSFPMHVSDIFFIKLNFEREPESAREKEVEFAGEVKVTPRNEQDKLQINVRLMSSGNTSFKISMEAVGLFDYMDEKARENLDLITDFVNNQALALIWMQFKTYLKLISVSMGMGTVQLPLPQSFNVPKDALFQKI